MLPKGGKGGSFQRILQHQPSGGIKYVGLSSRRDGVDRILDIIPVTRSKGRSLYYWHLQRVLSLIAVIARQNSTDNKFKSFSSIPSLHLIQGHWCHWCKYTLPAMAPAVGCSQANSSCSEPRSGVGMVYNNMILDTILFTQLDNM